MWQVEDRWRTVVEIRHFSRSGDDRIYRWIETKKFPAPKAGRLLRFKLSEVDGWVRADNKKEKN